MGPFSHLQLLATTLSDKGSLDMLAVRMMLDHGVLKRIKRANRDSCLRWLFEQGNHHHFLYRIIITGIHLFAYIVFTSSDKALQEAGYRALCAFRFDHPLPLVAFVSTLVALGAKPDVLKAAGFDVRPPNVHHTRAERESLLGEWLIIVETLSQ